MHVTSNPFFAFHDDVFPAFAKNAVAQPRFPTSFGRSTIIPNNLFSSLAELNHISTVNLNGTDDFNFELNFPENIFKFEETKILECNFFDGSTLLSFGVFKNGSLWIDSDYFENRIILKSNLRKSSEFAFHSNSSSALLDVFEEQYKLYCIILIYFSN